MHQTYEPYGSAASRPSTKLPLIGLFRCLYCGRGFGLKRKLNRHYRAAHSERIPQFGPQHEQTESDEHEGLAEEE